MPLDGPARPHPKTQTVGKTERVKTTGKRATAEATTTIRTWTKTKQSASSRRRDGREAAASAGQGESDRADTGSSAATEATGSGSKPRTASPGSTRTADESDQDTKSITPASTHPASHPSTSKKSRRARTSDAPGRDGSRKSASTDTTSPTPTSCQADHATADVAETIETRDTRSASVKPDPKRSVKRVRNPAAVRLAGLANRECAACGGPASNADHFLPRAQGGDDCPENIIGLCGSGTTECHGAKHGSPYTVRWIDRANDKGGVQRRDQEWVMRRIGRFVARHREDAIRYVLGKLGDEPGRHYLLTTYYITDTEDGWVSLT